MATPDSSPTSTPSPPAGVNGEVLPGKCNEVASSQQGAADQAPPPAAGEQSFQAAVKRAEAIGEQAARWTSAWFGKIAGATAHVREALEDLWAEAQDIRREKNEKNEKKK